MREKGNAIQLDWLRKVEQGVAVKSGMIIQWLFYLLYLGLICSENLYVVVRRVSVS